MNRQPPRLCKVVLIWPKKIGEIVSFCWIVISGVPTLEDLWSGYSFIQKKHRKIDKIKVYI